MAYHFGALKRAVVFCVAISFVLGICPFAQAAPPPPPTLDLNLTSKSANLSAGNLVNAGPIPIKVGTKTIDVTSMTKLTPAEKLAVWQVFSSPTHTQSITLGPQGNAVGGSLTLGSHFSQYVSGLVIPFGVTATRDFGTASNLSLIGEFSDSGKLVLTSSNPSVTSAAITAQTMSFSPSANVVVSSPISLLNLTALNGFTNSTTISAPNLTINTPSLANNGSLVATASGGSLAVQSTAGLAVSGTGKFMLTGGGAGLIVLSASNANALAFSGNQTFSTGASGNTVFASPQGSITFADGVLQTINGGGALSMITPALSFLGNVTVNASGNTLVNIAEGGTEAPLTITTPNGAIDTISTPGLIQVVATAGQNIDLVNQPGTGYGKLNLNAPVVNFFTNTASVNVDADTRLNSTGVLSLEVNPTQYIGLAFQPYVGPYQGSGFDAFSSYSLSTVTALLSQLKTEGITQVSTYGDGWGDYGTASPLQTDSNQYILPAAASLGMTVVAGANQWVSGNTWNLQVTESDITSILQFAQNNPGVVTALNVTNEGIEASQSTSSAQLEVNATNILTLVNYAIAQLPTYGFQNTNPSGMNYLPVTIREQSGTLTAVNQGLSYSSTLLQTLQKVNFVYANIYPYGFNYNGGASPQQSTFQTYVTNQLNSIYGGIQTAFKAQGLTSLQIGVGESGWPTAGQNTLNPPTPTSVQLAQWAYQSLYTWANTNNVQTFGFEAYNEPFKGQNIANSQPGSDQANFGIFVANGSIPSADVPYNETNNYALSSVTQQYNLTGSGAGSLVSTSSINNAGLVTAKTVNLNTSLLTFSGAGKIVGKMNNTTTVSKPVVVPTMSDQDNESDYNVVSTEDAMADDGE